jgi:hypothetical protein
MRHRFKKPSRAGFRIICGVTGLAVALLAFAVPKAGAATLPSAPGSNARLLSPAHPPAAPRTRTSAPNIIRPKFSCKGSGTLTGTVSYGISGLDAKADYSKKKGKLVFSISGTPTFSVDLSASGKVNCDATATVPVQLPYGLVLDIGPHITFDASAKLDAKFTWSDKIEGGFTFTKKGVSDDKWTATDGSGVDFSGDADASVALDLEANITTDAGIVGVTADIGPTIDAKSSGSTTEKTACYDATADNELSMEAYFELFGIKGKVHLGPYQLGAAKTYSECTPVFYGEPGTNAPPDTMGPYTMTAFPADPSPEGTDETELDGPNGTISFNTPLQHAIVGSDWQTWSNGYTGDVYADTTVLSDGDVQVTVTLPPHTGAFYAYAEPDKFEDYDMSATSMGGSSGDVTVAGDAGASYFGFYVPCGHSLKSITYTDSGGDDAMAIGEFGIAHSC